jgi:hypothetical protein
MTCATAAPKSRATSLLLGRIAVEKGYLRPLDLDRCVRAQVGDPLCRGGRFMAPLGEILVSRGYLSDAQLGELLDEQRRRLDAPLPGNGRVADALFGRQVVREGLASESAVNAALRLQAVMEEIGVGDVPRLGQLLVERGVLAAADVERLLARRPAVGLS